MAVRTKFYHFKTSAEFVKQVTNNGLMSYEEALINNNNDCYYKICFIDQTKQIYTHGVIYDCAGYDDQEVLSLIQNLTDSLNTKVDSSVFNDLVSEVEENEFVVAKSLTDLNHRISSLESGYDSNYATIDQFNQLGDDIGVIAVDLQELTDDVGDIQAWSENVVKAYATKDELSAYQTKSDANTQHESISDSINTKQDVLTSTVNIKSINDVSILGEGNLDVGTIIAQDVEVNGRMAISRYTTIRINQNISDPSGMISVIDDNGGINAIRFNSHRVLGKKTSDGVMSICKLNDNDSNFYYDGTHAALDGSEGDVFMKLPKFYYFSYEVEPNVWDITLSYEIPLGPGFNEWNDNQLIAVYEGSVLNGMLNSVSGVYPTTNESCDSFKSYARAKGDGYSLVTFEQHSIMAFLFYAYYVTTGSHFITGNGSGNIGICGSSNSFGMEDSTSITSFVNFWGLENWYGSNNEFVDNAVVDNGLFKLNGENICEVSNGWISKMFIGNNLYAIPVNNGASNNDGYCDYSYFDDGITNVFRGGFDDEDSGIVYIGGNSIESNDNTSARLAFTGRIVNYDNTDVFKSLTIA